MIRKIRPIRLIRLIRPIKKVFFLGALALCIGLIAFWKFSNPAVASWWDDSWTFRKSIAITAHTAAENNVYISVTIDTSDTTRFQTDCGDVRFTKTNGELLPYYIVSGCSTASTVIHVNFDSFPAGAQTIYYYYGNLSAPDGFNLTDFSTEATNYTVGTIGSEEKSEGPVAYWGFDEGYGQTPQDSSANNYDGTLGATTGSSTDDPAWRTEDQCISGKCLKFDGGDYVSTGDVSQIDGTSAFTLSTWVKVNTLSDWAGVMAKSSTGTSRLGMELAEASYGGNNDVFLMVGNGANSYAYTESNIIDTNKWHLWTMVFDGTQSGNANRLKFYIDGVQKTLNFGGTTIPATTASNSDPIVIGAERAATSLLNGLIDEPKVYNYAKTATQIRADFNSRSDSHGSSASIGGSENQWLSQGLVGYWKMDEASGDLTDSSGNGSTGTVTGTTITTGKFANGRIFNGSSDKATINSFNTNLITAATWVNPSSLPGSDTKKRIITKYSGSGSTSGHWLLDLVNTSGTQSLRFIFFGPGGTNQANINYSLSTSTWSHLAATFDGSTIRIYVNGSQIGSATTTDTSIPSVSQSLAIAEDATEGSAAEYFAGTLDEARVYNKALSPKEVSDLYNFAPGPIGSWGLDEASGTDVYDNSSAANTLTAATTTIVSGKYGKARNFTGAAGSKIEGAVTNLPLGASPRTLNAWFRTTNTTARHRSIAAYGTAISGKPIYLLDVNATHKLYTESGSGQDAISSTASVNDGKWHFGSLTYDGTTLKLYLDGVFQGSSNCTLATTTSNFGIGEMIWDTTLNFIGDVDNVQLYNYARTQKQIVSDMLGGRSLGVGSNVGQSSPVGYWDFDEGADNKCSGGVNDVCNLGNGGSSLDGAESGMSVPATATSGWTNAGKFGKALIFDGSNDFITIQDNNALDVTTNFTISAWIYQVNSQSTGYRIFDKETAGVSDGYAFDTRGTTSGRRLRLCGNDACPSGNTDYSLNAWHHVVVSVSSSVASFYLDGKYDGGGSTGAIATNNLNALIGKPNGTPGSPAEYFNGSIDEVKIYNYPLTSDEVKTEYNRGSSMILGAAGNNSTYQSGAANQEYCVPGDTTSCAAPVGEWKMEEGSGGTTNDTSGNGNTGTLTGATIPTWNTGKMGKALKFDGTGNGYVDTGSWSPSTGAVTMSAWIYPMTTAQDGLNHVIVAKGNDGSSDSFLINNVFGDQVCMEIHTGGVLRYTCSPVGAVRLYAWNYITGVYNGSNSCSLYINGVLSTGGPAVACSGSFSTARSVWIGCETSPGCGYPFKGLIDDVKIFNYARSASQIAWDYNKGGPVGSWDFDECQGTTANDLSGNSNTGTITIGTGAGTGQQDSAGTCTASGSTAWYNGRIGKRNSSLNFDGIDDYVNLASFTINSSFTFAGWVNVPATWTHIYPMMISLRDNPTTKAADIIIRHSGVSNKARIQVLTGDTWYSADSNTALTAGWHHLVGTYNSTTQQVKLYVDGNINDTQTGPSSFSLTAGLRIGHAVGGTPDTDYYHNGQIDDVKIFNYALTSTQIKNLYNNGAINYGPSTGSP